jgi:hypothetical protein
MILFSPVIVLIVLFMSRHKGLVQGVAVCDREWSSPSTISHLPTYAGSQVMLANTEEIAISSTYRCPIDGLKC